MKLRRILRKYIINNIGYKILAVVFSFLLWLVILNITDPEYTRTISNIPVQVVNENLVLDGDHVYTISSGDVTSIILTGKRSIISVKKHRRIDQCFRILKPPDRPQLFDGSFLSGS